MWCGIFCWCSGLRSFPVATRLTTRCRSDVVARCSEHPPQSHALRSAHARVRVQEKSSPALSCDTQMEQQQHYEQVLEQQRQLLERVGGRSTPASSQKSSASTEVDGGAKRLDDDARKAQPAAGSQTPVTVAPSAAVSGRSPAAYMPRGHEAAARPQNDAQKDQRDVGHDFEGTLGGCSASSTLELEP